jgi:hypothetical protein
MKKTMEGNETKSCLPSSEFPSSPSVSSSSTIWRADGEPCSAAADVEAGARRQFRLVSGVTLPVALFSGVSMVAESFDFEEVASLLGAIFDRDDESREVKGAVCERKV